MGFVIPPYKATNMETVILGIILLTFIAVVYGYVQSEDNEIIVEVNRLNIPYFKLGIYMERYDVRVKVLEDDDEWVEKIQQEDVFTFSFVLISLQVTFFKILEA